MKLVKRLKCVCRMSYVQIVGVIGGVIYVVSNTKMCVELTRYCSKITMSSKMFKNQPCSKIALSC
jgi:hypothetical protein